jgi:hypothetical protein
MNQNLLDFGWRQYDPVIARWHVTDPAEQFYNPYLAIGANPVSLIDPDGRKTHSGMSGTSTKPFDMVLLPDIENGLGGCGGGGGMGIGSLASLSPYDMQKLQLASGTAIMNYTDGNNWNGNWHMSVGTFRTPGRGGGFIFSNTGSGASLAVIQGANTNYGVVNGQVVDLNLTYEVTVQQGSGFHPDPGNNPSWVFTETDPQYITQIHYTSVMGLEPIPTYTYKDESGLTATQLYTNILIDKTAEQFGIKDVAALAAVISGQPILPKRFNTPGATKGTSPASKYLSKIPGELPFSVPTLTNRGIRFTKLIGRFLGRSVPIVGWGVLVYDVGIVLYNTQVEFDNIVGGGQ